MPPEAPPTHFFYGTPNGARGFPLALASFFFSPEKAPGMPSEAFVRDMLQSRSPSVPISTAEIAEYLIGARKELPVAQDAFALLPFRIAVHIPGLAQRHELRYANAVLRPLLDNQNIANPFLKVKLPRPSRNDYFQPKRNRPHPKIRPACQSAASRV